MLRLVDHTLRRDGWRLSGDWWGRLSLHEPSSRDTLPDSTLGRDGLGLVRVNETGSP